MMKKHLLTLLLAVCVMFAAEAQPVFAGTDKSVEAVEWDWSSVEEPELLTTPMFQECESINPGISAFQAIAGVTYDGNNEAEMLKYLSDEIKEALLAGQTSVSIASYQIPLSAGKEIGNLAYYCPYVDPDNMSVGFAYSYSSSTYTQLRISNKMSLDATRRWVESVDDKLAKIYARLDDPALSEDEQALILHDYMVAHYHYDTTYQTSSHYSSSILMEDVGVCQAYAGLFQYVMLQLGYECHYNSSDSMNHAWNILKIGNKYYHIDVTWDDPVNDRYGQVKHDYFLLSDSNISDADHKHEGWNLSYTCNDNSYEDDYFIKATSPVMFYGDERYFVTGNNLVKYLRGTTTTVDSLGKWKVWDQAGFNWVGAFSGLFEYDGQYYYNTANQFRRVDPATDEVSVYATMDTTNGLIYGCVEKDDCITYAYQTNPSVDYFSADIRSLALPAPAHVHSYQVSRKEAGCVEEGAIIYTCACGDSYSEVIPAYGHVWDNGVVTKEASRIEEGILTYTCTRCGSTREEAIPLLVGKVPTVALTVEKLDANKLYFTGIFNEYADAGKCKPVVEHGLLIIEKTKLGAKTLTVNTQGRSKVAFSSYKEDGSFSYKKAVARTSTKYVVRSYLCYEDTNGSRYYVYSPSRCVSYDSNF